MSQQLVSCPFCGEPDFDLPGLTMHLNRQWCEASKNYCPECGVLMEDTFFHFKHCSRAGTEGNAGVPGDSKTVDGGM